MCGSEVSLGSINTKAMDYVKRLYKKDFVSISQINDFLMSSREVLVVNVETPFNGVYRLWYAIG